MGTAYHTKAMPNPGALCPKKQCAQLRREKFQYSTDDHCKEYPYDIPADLYDGLQPCKRFFT